MKVFKFGGASVKNAEAVRNVANVIRLFDDELLVVVSAMGKSTNKLEWILQAWYQNESLLEESVQEFVDFHNEIIRELFPDTSNKIYVEFNEWVHQMEEILEERHTDNYDFDYDRIVSFGELISTNIVHRYLEQEGLSSEWWDSRKLIRTDDNWRNGKVDWPKTEEKIQEKQGLKKERIAIAQGFIGATRDALTVTLGREGSDYSAAIYAYCLNADSQTIWKDVPGMLNADPKYFSAAKQIKAISYKEAIELAYYGATIIHPKTLKPLENKQIPLYVKSFVNPEIEGTVIQKDEKYDADLPSYIFKVNQILISIQPKDFSFIIEENLQHIFSVFNEHKVGIHLMQNSALNFSVVVNWDERRVPGLLEELKENYEVRFNDENIELITVRYFTDELIDELMVNKELLLEQRTRNTMRIVVKDLSA